MVIRENERILKETSIIHSYSFSDLKRVKTPLVELYKRGQDFTESKKNRVIKTDKLRGLIKIMKGLRIVRDIGDQVTPDNRDQYFGSKSGKIVLSFGKDSVEFILGKKLDFDQSFYAKIRQGDNTRYVIVKDTTNEPIIYDPSEVYRSGAKYNRLREILNSAVEAYL